MSDLRVRSSAKILKMGEKSFQVEPLTLPALGFPSEPDSPDGVWADEARIRKAASAWISRRPVIPFEDWEVDPDDRILVLAIDSAWSVGMLGADPDRIHPTDHVQVFQAASKSKPKGFGLDQVLKFCGISRYAWWEISGQLSDGMRLYDLVLLLGAHKDYGMPFYLSSAPRRAFTSLEERDRWFRWMCKVLWRRQSGCKNYSIDEDGWGDDPRRLLISEVVGRAVQEVLRLAPGKAQSIQLWPQDAFFGPIYWHRTDQDVERIMEIISGSLNLQASGQDLTQHWPEWERSTIGDFVDDLAAMQQRTPT